MSIAQRLTDAMKEAMKAKESERLGVIRLVRGAIKNAEIDKKITLTDADIISVMSTLLKQRRESAKICRDNDRVDLAETEEQEIKVLQEFLPQQLSSEELQQLVAATVAELGASSMKDMGAVMKVISPKTLGRADGRLVSEMVKSCLAK
jgi:hypothetical protein